MLNIQNLLDLKVAAAVCLLVFASGLAVSTTTAAPSKPATAPASCTVDNAATLNVDSQGLLVAHVDQGALAVHCTSATPYNIGLDAGAGQGATVAIRPLIAGGADADSSDADSSDAVAAGGSGASQGYAIVGHVQAQIETLTVTITY